MTNQVPAFDPSNIVMCWLVKFYGLDKHIYYAFQPFTHCLFYLTENVLDVVSLL